MNNKMAVRGGAGDILEPKVGTRPQDNLYLAVNSEWLENVKIPSDRSRIASFDNIDLDVEKKLMKDFADFADGKKEVADVPNLKKAVELYKLARDFKRRDEDGAKPIQADLALLEGIRDFADFNLKAPDLFKAAFALPFSFDVDADMKNTKINVLQFFGSSIFLPDTTTYKTDAAQKLLDVLKRQSIELLKMAGLSAGQAEEYVDDAMKFDDKVSKVVKSSEEWADYPAMYNPMPISDFEKKITNFKMDYFLKEALGEVPDRVIVAEPRYLDHFDELINEDNFDEIKGWMIVKFINGVASYLSQDFREASFPFSQALSGQPELQSQEKQAYHLANGIFSEVVGVYYGKTYFGEDAKKDVLSMIHKMLDVYEERIKNNDWLSEETKHKAIVKLRALILKIGYPDKIEEIYDRLHVTPASEGGSLYSNARAAEIEQVKYNVEKLHKPVDRTVWLMPGNLVNACYDPQRNDLTFPAGILQKPFYDINQSRGANYGGIGATIGHEVSHAFDNNGAKFDENGNMNNWWTKQDFTEFNKRVGQMIDIFDGLQYGPAKINGKQVVSENIADLAGLACAVQAGKSDGADLKDLFENYARSWMEKQRPEAIKTEVQTDVHAPQPTRVNIPVQCQDEFYDAFGVKKDDGMWLDPEDRIVIW